MHMVAVNSGMTFIWPLLSVFIHPSPLSPLVQTPKRGSVDRLPARLFFWCRPSRDVAVLSVLCFFLVILGIRLFDALEEFL